MAFTGKNPRFEGVIYTDQGASGSVTAPASGSHKLVDRNGIFYVVDSTGAESPLGIGSGTLNLIDQPNNAAGATASGAGVTVATTTTSSELPLEGIIPTAIKITNVSGTDYVRWRFTMPASLKNRKLELTFWQRALSGYTNADNKIEVYKNAASNYGGAYTEFALSTDSSGTSSLNNYSGLYKTTFDADDADYYEIRIVRVSGTAAIAITNLTVGPGSAVVQSAAVTEVLSYTPTYTGIGTVSNNSARWARVGDSIEVWGYVTAGTVAGSLFSVTLPESLTIDSTKIPINNTSSNAGQNVGLLEVNSTTQITTAVLVTATATSTSLVYVGHRVSVNASGLIPQNGNTIFTTGDVISWRMRLPISQFAGSGTVNVAQNDVEYAYNSSVTDATDTTSFAYGPQGGQFGNFTALRTKRVQFQTPIQPSDEITLEVTADSGVTWAPVGQNSIVHAYQQPNGVFYGAYWEPQGASSVSVNFGTYRINSATTYAGAGTDWSAIDNDSVYRWRLKKCKAGQAVGFGNVGQTASGLVKSAGQLLGTSTNDTAAEGYVGEIIEATETGTSVSDASTTNIASVLLTPGCWDVSGVGGITRSGGSITSGYIYLSISETSATRSSGVYETTDDSGGSIDSRKLPTVTRRITVATGTTKTAYLVLFCGFAGGGTMNKSGSIRATRVR